MSVASRLLSALRPIEGDRRDPVGDLPAEGLERAPPASPSNSTSGRSSSRPARRSAGRSARRRRRRARRRSPASWAAKSASPGRRLPGHEQVAIGQPDEDRPADRPSSAARWARTSGQQDPGRRRARRRCPRRAGAGRPRFLVGPLGAGRPGRQVGDRGRVDIGRLDAPGQQVLAVDDDVEPVAGEHVDDGEVAGPSPTSGRVWASTRSPRAARLDLGEPDADRPGRPEERASRPRRGRSSRARASATRRRRGIGGDRHVTADRRSRRRSARAGRAARRARTPAARRRGRG